MTGEANTLDLPEDISLAEEEVDRYLDALIQADAMDIVVPAAALAELLAARLEHRSSPEARALLESFALPAEKTRNEYS